MFCFEKPQNSSNINTNYLLLLQGTRCLHFPHRHPSQSLPVCLSFTCIISRSPPHSNAALKQGPSIPHSKGGGVSSNSPGAGVPHGATYTLGMLSQAAFQSCTAREVTGIHTSPPIPAQTPRFSTTSLTTTFQPGRNIFFAEMVFYLKKKNSNWPGWRRISKQAAGKIDTWNRGKQERNQFFPIQPVMTASMYLAVAV